MITSQKQEFFEDSNKRLSLLLLVFIAGFILLICMHFIFSTIISKFDDQTANLKTKIQIGEFIAEDIYKIRSDFFEIATSASNQRGREIIRERLSHRIAEIQKMLDVIDNGGEFKRVIRLNIANHNDTTKTIQYKKTDNTNISIESIDVRPKLDQLLRQSDELLEMLQKRDELITSNNTKEIIEYSREINRYYKTAPAYFARMTENIRRLLYEGDLELQKLQKNIEANKQFYVTLELALIALTVLIVLSLGYMISKQINKSNKELKKLNDSLGKSLETLRIQEIATRGILDAQPNIVIVSDGASMKDTNRALFNFFDQYHSLEEFKREHVCICEFFEPINDEYIVNKDYDGKNWLLYVLDHPQTIHKVAMLKNEKLFHFILNAEVEVLDDDNKFIVVTLTDITNEITANQKLKDLNANLESIVQYKTKELHELNEQLEERIKIEVDKNRQKERQLMQQSRSAALGEMIANIAHQWRQPLSAISSTSSSVQLQMSLGIISETEIKKALNDVMGYVQFLTQTIEDFRNYFKEDKEKMAFLVNDVLNRAISVISSGLKDCNIEVAKSLDENMASSFGYPNELSQVFLNILNNAKDASLNKAIETRYIYIKTTTENEFNVIYIYDNAGGIPENIINKIFDPYFTTKHQSQGTGIGLYMSKEIVEKHMNGSIMASNEINTFENKIYNGACFKISIPQNICTL